MVAVRVDERPPPRAGLPVARPARELAIGLHGVTHAARDPAMSERQQPAVSIQRQGSPGRKSPLRTRSAAPPRGAKPISSSRMASVIVNES